MKRDYFTFNFINSTGTALKRYLLTVVIMLSVAFAYSQETITITTTSNDPSWLINFQNSGGLALEWQAIGPGINISDTGNNPSFDFSANVGNGDIVITITSNDDFDFVTELFGSATDIISVADFSNMQNILELELPNNQITTIDLSGNTLLTDLTLSNNTLTALDLSANTLLEEVLLQLNNLTTLDMSAHPSLARLDLSVNDLTSINILNATSLTFLDLSTNQLPSLDLSTNVALAQISLLANSLTTVSIGQILDDVDAYGTGAFGYILDLRGNPGDIPAGSIGSLNNLLARNWIVRPPAIYDFGDAPNSYTTNLASGGPQHIIGDGDLNLGLVFDDELDGLPSATADGDDLDNVDDEDGVTAINLTGITTSTDSFSIDVDITNNTSSGANLYAWIDFDGNGTFEADEFTSSGAPNGGANVVTLTWSNLIANGVDINAGDTFARFRITSDVLAANQPGGIVNNGEVEDYTLVIDLDTDSDGVPDINDDDADNDGILNTDEVGDTNLNGIDDMLELDSDDDGCFDVAEAGFTDGDDDGILGTSPVVVDANGLITNDALGPIGDGFTTPNDLDVNGTYDFQEAGLAATITTQPVDQLFIFGNTTFSTVAVADTYLWEESTDGGTTWLPLADAGDYSGTGTADLVVANAIGDISKLTYRYRVVVNNIAFACDPTTTSNEVTYITPDDTDNDLVYDIVDEDDDNDGITDTDEGDQDTTGDGLPDVFIDSDGDGLRDSIELDADNDACFDVTEAGFTDNGFGLLGTVNPPVVGPTGLVTSTTDGYTVPNDLNASGTPDFQEAGAAANITTQPTDQDLIIGDVTFTVVTDLAPGDESYQWQESIGGVGPWTVITDAVGFYSGAQTASLVVTNVDVSRLTDRYRILLSNVAYACDPITTSDEVTYITPEDFDLDTIFDIVDVDDDNDGILDVDEAGNTIPATNEDRINLDSDGDGCFDVTEAGFTDNGMRMLGTSNPPVVDATGRVTSATDGYTVPNDLNGNLIPDFQEVGAPANITTPPADQIYVLAGSSTFSVVTDLVAGDESFQWEESIDNGTTWNTLTDVGDYSGTTTADLVVSTPDFSKVNFRYRVLVNNVAYICDPITTSTDATFITPGDFDKDLIFDVVDVDDDNDGILDVDEAGNTDPGTNPDATNLDSDSDGCFDVTEAGFTDVNGDGQLGNFPISVDANGQVTSGTDGYTPPNDLSGSGTPDFQEAGATATITSQPVDQNLIIGVTTFSVVATADTYQWEESTDGGATWTPLVDAGDYAGTTTADLLVTNIDVSKLTFRYRVLVNNIGYACDPTTLSAEARYIAPTDFDNDGVFDIVDVDDDNDGILDTVEPGNTDPGTNPDATNLDSDNDGCFDVTEAGFTDNGMGMLGTSNPPVVDATGLVTSATDGYTAPNDLDSNGILDFQETGAAAIITTQPVDQNFLPGATVVFDVVASADTYQWEESTDGSTWTAVVDGGNYAGATTTSLTISNVDVSMLGYMYRVMVNNIAYACDPVSTSDSASLVSLPDNDNDLVPDVVDVDDDNDGILDTVEDNGIVDRDTDGDGIPDKFQLDADADGCFDVTEAGFTDNGMGMLGTTNPPVVDVTGQVTSATDGYTAPNDLDNNGIADFQEAGTVANITGDPVDQDFILNGSATFTAASDGDSYQWEISTNGVNFTPLTDDGKYSGTNTDNLTVSGLVIPDYFNEYRVVASNIAFVCDPGDTSISASYNILLDTDNDGVFDIVDFDDDNDGILDTVEGDVTDSNLDGKPDRLSLDSDSDSCADAIEAGFTDPDGDGILGTSPVTVDANGQVTGQGGYTTPNDLDSNGVFDFQEVGEPSAIENQPEEVEIALGDDAIFEVSATATFYQWQQSMDGGTTWTDLVNDAKFSGVTTDRLLISDARGRLEGSWYRVVLTSPDFACDPVTELISDGVRLVFNTELIPSGFSPNGDGENDLFSVPGLIETPNFEMEVFDRWGNSVYKYKNNGSLSPDWWDGRSTGNMTLSKGQQVPAGTYFYLIQYNDGNKSPDKGWVYVNY